MNFLQFKNKRFIISVLLIAVSFSLMSFHPKNNFRIEKRHYRKGFYVDIWVHPKTYPRTYSTPNVAVKTEETETTTPATATNGSPSQDIKTKPDTSVQQNDNQNQSEQNTNESKDAPSVDNATDDVGGKSIQIQPQRNIAPVSSAPRSIAPNH